MSRFGFERPAWRFEWPGAYLPEGRWVPATVLLPRSYSVAEQSIPAERHLKAAEIRALLGAPVCPPIGMEVSP